MLISSGRKTAVLLVCMLFGCRSQEPSPSHPVAAPQAPQTVRLKLDGDSRCLVTIMNNSDSDFVFDPSDRRVAVYSESGTGRRSPITMDVSDYKIAPIRPFGTVLLVSGASYTLTLPVLVRSEAGVDRRGLLHRAGVVYAEVRRLSAESFEPEFREQARGIPFLSKTLVSNRIRTPVSPRSDLEH